MVCKIISSLYDINIYQHCPRVVVLLRKTLALDTESQGLEMNKKKKLNLPLISLLSHMQGPNKVILWAPEYACIVF